MEIKLIEVRDRMTFIPAIAIRISGEDGWLARRAGYGVGSPLVLFGHASGGRIVYDINDHGSDYRTMPVAHAFVTQNWDTLKDGDVVDVEFILGEVTEPKRSELYEELIP